MSPTYLARLTPSGIAALATLGLFGPQAWDMVRAAFRPAGSSPLPELPVAGRFWFGRFGAEGASDEVVLAVKRVAPVPLLEMHCHGGSQAITFLEEILIGRGATACSWQEFSRHAGAPEWRVAAQEALSRAATVRTAAILLDQYQGACEQALARIEADLQADRIEEARGLLAELDGQVSLGRHLTEPWQVVIAGAPNVGKSSLLNAIAGFARAVVSPEPGTTRDVVTVRVALDGWPVELADTAGWRDAEASLEKAGIERAQTAARSADLVLWVVDASAPLVIPDAAIPGSLVVINKVDLPITWDSARLPDAMQVSARTGAGITELCQRIADRLVPHPPAPLAAVPFDGRLCENVSRLRASLQTRP